MPNNHKQPTIFCIFGAGGDLSKRKLFPALYNLFIDRALPEKFSIVGLARSCDLEPFQNHMRDAVEEFSRQKIKDEKKWSDFAANIHFLCGEFGDEALYKDLFKFIADLEKQWGCEAVHVYYMSVPPSIVEMISDNLDKAHLAKERKRERLVIEKPFGRDLESADDLNRRLLRTWHENQIFRIDHYLGKETVQNLLAFRFGNALYEPIWNRNYIDHVQVTVAEEVGVEKRGGYYDHAGALRDMIQNHLLQLMCMVAMEPPVSFNADEVRNKKVDVLKAIRPLTPETVPFSAVRGQYGHGNICGVDVPGYREEEGVDPHSQTETYAAVKLYIDNWRWQDVPFYLRTGKRLEARISQIIIAFRPVPHQMFPLTAAETIEPNRMVINIQPEEEIILRFQAKEPGTGMYLRTASMDFRYQDEFQTASPEAYETLLYDVMVGDGTLFMRDDQEHAAWKVVTPILEVWENTPAFSMPNYAAGSWGPSAANTMLAQAGHNWFSPLWQRTEFK
ncbi:MAG TPA: glucose-6-phosphate dehydrogenase [Fimbriimonadaceae bacterium]|nr:glucose-6-phosphate dehydrogenase [Fimbriimonadaceae bacterium]